MTATGLHTQLFAGERHTVSLQGVRDVVGFNRGRQRLWVSSTFSGCNQPPDSPAQGSLPPPVCERKMPSFAIFYLHRCHSTTSYGKLDRKFPVLFAVKQTGLRSLLAAFDSLLHGFLSDYAA
jgi:hypothetical protein